MRVGVIGGGLMGSGIAEVCARSGVDVTLVEADEKAVERARGAVERSLERAVKGGKLEAAGRDEASEHLAYTASLEDLEGADAAIEAIAESESAKRELFSKLGEVLPEAEFIASNTSSIPITKLASQLPSPEKVLGLHFFNPVPVLPLVEIVRALTTSDEVVTKARAFAEDQLGKTCIDSQDRPGFIVNALLIPYVLSAVRMFESGFASREDIDEGMKLGCGHPIGPLALADLIGLDTMLAVAESLHQENRDAASVPPPLLNRMVEAGVLGRKSGQGFYDYRGDGG